MQSLFSHENDFEGIYIFDLHTDPKIGMIMCAEGEGDDMIVEILRPNGVRERTALIKEYKRGNITKLNSADSMALHSVDWDKQ